MRYEEAILHINNDRLHKSMKNLEFGDYEHVRLIDTYDIFLIILGFGSFHNYFIIWVFKDHHSILPKDIFEILNSFGFL